VIVRITLYSAPQFLIAFEFSVMTISVAALAAELGLAAPAVPLVFASYSLAFGGLLLAWGRGVDRLGARRCLIAGLVVFGVGIAGSAGATATGVLLAARAVAGAGAAAMTPAGLAGMTAAFPAPGERRVALAWYAAGISLGFVSGALAAGTIGQLAGWRAAVASTAVVATAALVATIALTGRNHPPRVGARQARTGAVVLAVLAAVSASAVICGFTTRLLPAAPAALGALLASALGAAAWRRRPLVGRGKATARLAPVIGGAAAVTATGVTGTLLLALYLRDVRLFTPMETAFMFAAFGIPALAGHGVARLAAAQRGAPAVLAAGLALQGTALALLAASIGIRSPVPVLVAAIAAFGAAHLVANTGVALCTASAPDRSHGSVAALVATAQYMSGALGPSIIVSTIAGHGGPGLAIAVAGALAWAAGSIVRLAARA
jgi:MFS family permease